MARIKLYTAIEYDRTEDCLGSQDQANVWEGFSKTQKLELQ